MTYEELMKEIDEMTRTYHAFAVAIDGADHVGKHALAAHLSRKFGAPVIHMRDFRLPTSERPATGDVGCEMDFERYNEEIAEPWLRQGELVYSILNDAGEITERLALPNAQIYIVEGNYAWHPAVKDFYDLRLFMKASEETRAAHAASEGVALDFAQDARLASYFSTYMIEEFSDAVLGADFDIPAEADQTGAEV